MVRASSLLDRLAEHASVRPDATAIVLGEERVSYAELTTIAQTAFAEIRKLALPPTDPVAIHAVKSPRTIALIIACLHARLPFLLPSVELGADTFSTLLDQAGCGDLLVAEPPGPDVGRRTHKIDCTVATGGRERLGGTGGPDDVSFMLTTSGSTGVPKIVPLTVGAVDRFTDWAAGQFHIGPDSTVLNYAPLNFDVCLLDIWATLKAGGTAVLVEADRSTNGRYLTDLVRSHRIGVIQAVPMLFRLLGDAWDGQPFTDVEHVVLTGDKVSARLLAELPGMFPAARVWNLYGCTETNDSFLHDITGSAVDAEVPVGRPIAGVSALVVDEDGTVLEGPASGELYVNTPFQTTGYLDPSGVTSGRFVQLGGRPHRYFRSGDLVSRSADGVFTLVGRNDFQVKVRGTRVNLEEIELAILDHEDVVEAAVIGLPDDVAGVRIHAVVRGAEPGSPGVLALREHCRLRLPRVAIPAAIQIVHEPLPTTSTGKVDRQEIRRSLQNRS
jgi:acyl-coenzyme A synthetase/AMP-(fatty) acid ligase